MGLPKLRIERTCELGDLVAAAFDEAEELDFGDDATSRVATMTVVRALVRGRNLDAMRRIARASSE